MKVVKDKERYIVEMKDYGEKLKMDQVIIDDVLLKQ